MLDLIMKLLGYENIKKITISEGYKIPRADKLRCKLNFYKKTGKFQDKIIVNKENVLLDGYITYILSKWADIKYVKILKIDTYPEVYKVMYRGYRLKSREKREIKSEE